MEQPTFPPRQPGVTVAEKRRPVQVEPHGKHRSGQLNRCLAALSRVACAEDGGLSARVRWFHRQLVEQVPGQVHGQRRRPLVVVKQRPHAPLGNAHNQVSWLPEAVRVGPFQL